MTIGITTGEVRDESNLRVKNFSGGHWYTNTTVTFIYLSYEKTDLLKSTNANTKAFILYWQLPRQIVTIRWRLSLVTSFQY